MTVAEVKRQLPSWSAAAKQQLLRALVAELSPAKVPTAADRAAARRDLRSRLASKEQAITVDEFLAMKDRSTVQ